MLHVLVGTKGQLIKTAPVMLELDRRRIPYRFALLGQHGEITNRLIRLFALREPDLLVNGNKGGVDSIASGGKWLFRSVLTFMSSGQQYPRGEAFLVHGDPISALQGAFLARLLRGKLIHLEAGLRSGEPFEPFPEELVRTTVDRCADLLLAPSEVAERNLGSAKGSVCNTQGNTVYDSIRTALNHERNTSEKPYALATIHRFETIARRCRLRVAVNAVIQAASDRRVIFNLHPSTRKRLWRGILSKLEKNDSIDMRPLEQDYFSFISLVSKADFVITDGGGLQEETYYLGTPCLLLRNVTERQDGIGTTCVLSRFRPKVISFFLRNYESHASDPVMLSESPSRIAVESLVESELL